MKEVIYGIPVEFGDARFRLYDIRLGGGVFSSAQAHEHHYYELHFARAGHYEYTVDGQRVMLRQGELLILSPEVRHSPIGIKESRDYRWSVIEFSLSRVAGRSGFFDYFQETLARFSHRAVRIPSSLLQAAVSFKSGVRSDEIGATCYRQTEAAALICKLFSALDDFSRNGSPALAAPDRSEDLVLLENMVNRQGYGLREIAQAVHYSERHTARLIRRIYHMSLSELRAQRRVHAAPSDEEGDGKDQTNTKERNPS